MSDLLLGIDLGSSSVKVSLVDSKTGNTLFSCFEPGVEMPIHAERTGWAEQDPEMWWGHTVKAIRKVMHESGQDPHSVAAVGISYQMHGLVLMDENMKLLRPSIIWCDSRAVDKGDELKSLLGETYCFDNLLNLPGNFTAAKLLWVRDHEPDVFSRIRYVMLPGDYLGFRFAGEPVTTSTGLSEGMFWNYQTKKQDKEIFAKTGIDPAWIPPVCDEFGEQQRLTEEAAHETGLAAGVPITYRAGDQPNNALSLKVSEPGQVAATAGTSGVIYAVTDMPLKDLDSRVNTFVHPSRGTDKYGVLLCVNGTGIANNWIRQVTDASNYILMNEMAGEIQKGSEGLLFYPFGNGAERMLGNKSPGGGMHNISFNIHSQAHLYRAVQEGVCYALYFGFEILESLDFRPATIRAADANMFRSSLFCQLFADITGCDLELYHTDGSRGAAMAAGVGLERYPSMQDIPLQRKAIFSPDQDSREKYLNLYENWKILLNNQLKYSI